MSELPKRRWIASPNCRAGAADREIAVIVLHYTASLRLDGTIAWFRNPKARVSAHYLVGRAGELVQMVRDQDVAWHAGVSSFRGRAGVNAFSLGIELVGTHDSGFTVRQLDVLYRLLEGLVVRYRVDADRVVGHADVAPMRKIDPDGYARQFPWPACRWVVKQARAGMPRAAAREAAAG